VLNYEILILAGDIIAPGHLCGSHRIRRIKVICWIQIIRRVQSLNHLFQDYISQLTISGDMSKTTINLADGFYYGLSGQFLRIYSLLYVHTIIDQSYFFLFNAKVSTEAIAELAKCHGKSKAVVPFRGLSIKNVIKSIICGYLPVPAIRSRLVRIYLVLPNLIIFQSTIQPY